MLLELRVENLLLIERAELRLGPGLNAITGETGAGKTVLAHALDLLLGGRPRPGVVRPGSREAWVEGLFAIPPGLLEDPALADLRERLPAEVDEIAIGRRVAAGGRTRAFVEGRSATVADLQALGSRLVSFYGQHEHRRLTVAAAQLEVLDGFGGPGHIAARDQLAAAHARAGGLRRRMDELRGRAGSRDRDLDLLVYELGEIEALEPGVEDEERLVADRERLRHLEALRAAAAGGAELLVPEAGEATGAIALLAEAARLAGGVPGVDPRLDALAERLAALHLEAEDVAAELHRYERALEGDPAALVSVEERLDLYDRLKRKHGGTVSAVLAHAEHCRAERARLEDYDAGLAELEGELAAAAAGEAECAEALSAARAQAAPRLAERVRDELSELAMDGALFDVELHRRGEIGPTGAETAEFMLAPNPGVPAAPIRDAASGGELSRVMLALMTVAAAGGGRTLVFDEVDAGIGGQTARAVGERLRRLAEAGQVLCITHLPQIASLADHHFRIEKEAGGEMARTTVKRLAGGEVVAEICRMLGADAGDAGARRHAQELLAAA